MWRYFLDIFYHKNDKEAHKMKICLTWGLCHTWFSGDAARILTGLSSYGMPNLTLVLFPLGSIFVTWRDYFILFLQYCIVFYPFKSLLHDYLSFQMIFSPFLLKSNQRSYYCNVFFPLKFVDYLSIDFFSYISRIDAELAL